MSQQDERLPKSRYVLFFLLAAAVLAIDLGTKAYFFANYYPPNQQNLWVDGVSILGVNTYFGIETSTNGGALFGIGQGMYVWFAILSLVALTGIVVWLFVFKAAREKVLTIALAMVTGGILGNLFDRLGFGFKDGYPLGTENHVRDFIYFRLEGVTGFDPWPNFNMADSMLVCGAILLFVHAFFFTSPEKKKLEDQTNKKEDDESKTADPQSKKSVTEAADAS
jgi:signal peptidase II